MKTCDHCSEVLDMSHFTTHGDICNKCLDSDYEQDDDSKEWHLKASMVDAFTGSSYRPTTVRIHCDNENYIVTDNGEYWNRDYTRTTHDGLIISDRDYDRSYFTCEDCGEIFHNDDDSNYIHDHGRVCQGCYDDGEYTFCESEGEYVHVDNCGCNEEEDDDGLHAHDYKPTPVFKGKTNELNPYMGIELEVEAKSGPKGEMIRECKEFSSDLYLKHDGSLQNGFEIVTHPMTLQEHKKNKYDLLLNTIRDMGAKSHDTNTCGLHVHLDKRNMSDAHKVRFGGFFAVCKPELEVFARRSSEQWSRFKEIKGRLEIEDYARSDSRYEAVNWTNSHTVEVRIFKGTLKFETFQASVELCHAIYTFTHKRSSFNATVKGCALWDKFLDYVKANKKQYKFLADYLESKKHQIGIVREKQKENEVEEMAS